MQVTVRFFGYVQEALGVAQTRLDIRAGDKIKDVIARLQTGYPKLSGLLDARIRFAVGTEYADIDAPLRDGDTVSLIPPVGGG